MANMLHEMTGRPGTEPSLSEVVTRASLERDTWAGPAILREQQAEIRVVALDDPEYPRRLRAIPDPPKHLHVVGRFNQPGDDIALAIVGSRTASSAGLAAAQRIAAEVASCGHTIVSGLAAGIDTNAHAGALDAKGRTVAVVGTGADRVYPIENRKLRDGIATTGAIVSQFALGHPPSKTTFPARNVLIAGLSAASLLVELNERSGTRIEATITIEQSKPVLLWAPLLGHASWAQEYAQHPLVSFVDSVADILHILSGINES